MRLPGACVFFALICTCLLMGQTLERGDVHGTVLDPAHAVIPNAKVTLSSSSTGFQRNVVTDAAGHYNFPQVPPGEYQLLAESPSFTTTKVSSILLHVGGSLDIDINMPVKGTSEEVNVTATAVDVNQAGISELINSQSVSSLPLSGRDYRDLAQLTPSAQVVPGLRGGIRLGGQQSDYTGIAIDGGDSFNNSFGEFFGSLETKNFTIPLDAVQEFQVVTNGFAPEFGRSTGGLLNVVTKSGTNDVHGSAHYYMRHKNLTANDALNNPSNVTWQHQFGASIGFPIKKDRQFMFLAVDRQQQHGPLITKFARNVSGVAVPELGIADLASLEGDHTQFQNLFSVLGHYDYQINNKHHFSARAFFTRNHTSGFTGGRGQNEVSAAFDNTENFHNQGVNSVFTLNSVLGNNKVNEVKLLLSGETRPRHPNGNATEVQIADTGNFGQRFFLPINGDNGKLQAQDNFDYVFGKHDIKFGGDADIFFDRKDTFAGWSRGTYLFGTLEDFEARKPFGFIQGFGLNGKNIFQAAPLAPTHQIGIGLYWQDKWQVSNHFTLTYGLRWDGSKNPQQQTRTPGQQVYIGIGPIGPGGSHLAPVPQKVPNDYTQFGPRVGAAYSFGPQDKLTVLRAAWGLYYAQTPTIFFPTSGGEKTSTLFCFGGAPPACAPPGGFPNLYPSALQPNDPLIATIGPPGITYVDPAFKNPRVSNLTVGVEQRIATWTLGATYAYSHSDHLRTGGFSTTQWARNVVVDHYDQFGRAIVVPFTGADPTIAAVGFGTSELASFSHSNYHEFVVSARKSFAQRWQLFSSYTVSQNKDNASSERDTDTFFGPQDPFNINLDYGTNGLDIRHQFKSAVVVTLPYGFTLSDSIQVRSGLPYPAYSLDDINNDAVANQVAFNDRPVVTPASGKAFLLPRYPARQPNFFQTDFRVEKNLKFSERYNLDLLADMFNLTNHGNLFSNPNNSAFVPSALTAVPQPSATYRKLDQISPGSLPFAVQLGLRLNF